MKTKYTPGPWAVDITTNDNREAETIRGPDGARIAATYKVHEHRENKTAAYYEARANARLIAAAPEMLDVLQVIAADIENRARLGLSAPAWYARARAAIDKATGV